MGKSSCWLAALAALAFVCPYAEAGALYNSTGCDSRVLYDNHQVSCGPHTCGVGAHCTYGAVTPVCACLPGYAGDPLTRCIRPECLEALCEPNPCGANAKCTPGHDRTGAELPICTCPSGYIGNPFVACERGECELDSECPDNRACVGYQCVDPCLGDTHCGSGAHCMARRHLAVCTCPPGYHGDALVICYERGSHIVSYGHRTYPQTLIALEPQDSATAKEVEQSSESQSENSTSSSA